MDDDRDELASLQHALADAERARDEARAETVALQQQWENDRREEQHHLRNMFSVIRSIARRSGDDVETVEDYCGVLDGRLRSYLQIQASLARDWLKGVDLGQLISSELLTFDLQEGEGVELDGPSITLTGRAAGLLALTFHELASAGIRSGRFEDGRTTLRIEWVLEGEKPKQSLLIEWREIASDRRDDEEARSSWTDWIEQAIVHQLSGTVTTHAADTQRSAFIRLPSSVIC